MSYLFIFLENYSKVIAPNSRENFSYFGLNGLLLLFSRLIHEFPNSRRFSTGTN